MIQLTCHRLRGKYHHVVRHRGLRFHIMREPPLLWSTGSKRSTAGVKDSISKWSSFFQAVPKVVPPQNIVFGGNSSTNISNRRDHDSRVEHTPGRPIRLGVECYRSRNDRLSAQQIEKRGFPSTSWAYLIRVQAADRGAHNDGVDNLSPNP